MKGKKVNFAKFSWIIIYVLLLCIFGSRFLLNQNKEYKDNLQKRNAVIIDSLKNLTAKPAETYPLKIYSSADYSAYDQNDLRNKLYWGIIVDDTIKVGTLDELKELMEKPLSK